MNCLSADICQRSFDQVFFFSFMENKTYCWLALRFAFVADQNCALPPVHQFREGRDILLLGSRTFA